jgi:hypothetical protein
MNRTLLRTLGALTCLWVLAAHATSPLPPSTFTNDITLFGADQCPGSVNASTDGYCFAGTSVAHSNGGVPGSPGFDPTALPGTHVSATAASAGIQSQGAMTYSFQVGGPLVPGGQIAVNILSSGSASVMGMGSASALLTLTEAGSDSGITGPSDPNEGLQLSLSDSVNCMGSRCITLGGAWNQTDDLCLTQGDVYKITIVTKAGALTQNTLASATIDPRIVVDPVTGGPTMPCFQPPNPSAYLISVSPGASAGGTGVPEPGTLGLLVLGMLALGVQQLQRARGARASAHSGRPSFLRSAA